MTGMAGKLKLSPLTLASRKWGRYDQRAIDPEGFGRCHAITAAGAGRRRRNSFRRSPTSLSGHHIHEHGQSETTMNDW